MTGKEAFDAYWKEQVRTRENEGAKRLAEYDFRAGFAAGLREARSAIREYFAPRSPPVASP